MRLFVRFILEFCLKMHKSRKDPLPKIPTLAGNPDFSGQNASKPEEAGKYSKLGALELALKTV